MSTLPPSLRERNRRAAEIEISESALELFEKQGIQSTSVEQIASGAGVSERTVFRYFAHKEDTALVAHTELRRTLRESIDESTFAQDPLQCILEAYEHVFVEFDDSESPLTTALLRVDRLKNDEPLLLEAGLRVDSDQTSWLIELLTERGACDRLDASVIAETVGQLFRLTLQRWADTHRQGADPATMLETFHEVREANFRLNDALRDRLGSD